MWVVKIKIEKIHDYEPDMNISSIIGCLDKKAEEWGYSVELLEEEDDE